MLASLYSDSTIFSVFDNDRLLPAFEETTRS